MDVTTQPKVTAAFYAQAVASFGISLTAVAVGIVHLPAGGWIRAFLGVGVRYVVTSAFTLAKWVRDAQESGTVVRRVDQARLDKLLAEHDPVPVACRLTRAVRGRDLTGRPGRCARTPRRHCAGGSRRAGGRRAPA